MGRINKIKVPIDQPEMKLKPGLWIYEYRILSAKRFYPESKGSFTVNFYGKIGNGLSWDEPDKEKPKKYIHSWTSENEKFDEDGTIKIDLLIRKLNDVNRVSIRKVVFTFLEDGYLLGHFYDIKNNGYIGDTGIIRARHKQVIEEVADDELDDDDDDGTVNLIDISD